MEQGPALAALREVRRDTDVVITTMGAARDWMALGAPHPLDFVFVPSSMGQGTSVGLGLAIARPDLRIIVCNGDGSTLMNLGSLVTITAESPPNLIVIVFDNGVYEVTGAQPTPAAPAGRAGGTSVDYLAIARACGFTSVVSVTDLDVWRRDARALLDAPGPTFVHIAVPPVPNAPAPKSPGVAKERGARFMTALKRAGAAKTSDAPRRKKG
jgi:phosphonopyruvate decarboxylase